VVDRLWVDHYSSYNKRRSWHAVALRSFGGDAAFIEKPAEMSKAWKAEHADSLAWTARDTPLMRQLPALAELAHQIPGGKQRVRLMRLTAGGELSRHADITDKEAGIQTGKVARIHIPLISNEACRFQSWRLDGLGADDVFMQPGRAWYLDTRKPHAARNAGRDARVHLVIDAMASPALRALLPC